MKVTLVGVKEIEAFETREGNTIEGVKLHIAYPDSDTYGNVCDNKFIDRKVYDSFGVPVEQLITKIGEVINLEFNPKMKVVGLDL